MDPFDQRPREQTEPGLSKDRPVKTFTRDFRSRLEVCLHYHASLEINHSSSEVAGEITVDGRSLDLASHPIILLSPGKVHSYNIRENSGRMRVLHIDLAALGAYFRLDRIFRILKVSLPNLPVTTPRYERLIPSLEALAAFDGATPPLEALLGLFTQLGRIEERRGGEAAGGDLRIKAIMDYTEEHLAEDFSLDEISAACGISRHYFCHFFKKRTSFTYWRYLHQVRIEHAEEKLRKGFSVAESGYASGFEDPAYFIRIYKKFRTITPGQYRRNWRDNT